MRPPASRRMVSADSAARSLQAVDDQIFLHAVDLAAAHAHRVDHRHAAGGDIVAVAHAAVGCQPMPGRGRRRRLLDQVEQRFRFRVSGLGGRPKPPCTRSARRAPRRPPRRSIDRALGFRLDLRRRGRRLTRRTARSGTTLLGDPPSIRDGLTADPGALEPGRAAARGRRGEQWRCGRPPDCARHGPSGRER
jgi:hypothetical protein